MRAVYLTAVWIHILAAATLVGGMVSFVVVVLPWTRQLDAERRKAALTDFGRRFRVLTWTTIGMLAATGLFAMWVRGVRLDHFLRSEWRSTAMAHLVIAKLTLAVVLAGLCLVHDRTRDRRWAKWTGRMALLVVLVIVAVAVQLVRGL